MVIRKQELKTIIQTYNIEIYCLHTLLEHRAPPDISALLLSHYSAYDVTDSSSHI